VPLEAVNLSFGYLARRPVLREVSLALEPGAVTAIVGPNGAGKSTLVRLLLGILEPGAGQVLLDGVAVGAIPHRQRARRLAYVPQRPSVAFAFSVRQYVELGGFAAPGVARAAADAALESAELAERADDPFPTLSAGQQQRAAMARAIVQLNGSAGSTSALLADEPVSAMDPRHALRAMGLLRSLAARGAAVGVVLHDLGLALRFCDRAAVLDAGGRLASAGPAASTLTPAVLDPVFGVRFTAGSKSPGVLVPDLPPDHYNPPP
jgi:iron complex transport system ATP-binding protein